MGDFFLGFHRIPYISKLIILNQNTCRNLLQRSKRSVRNTGCRVVSQLKGFSENERMLFREMKLSFRKYHKDSLKLIFKKSHIIRFNVFTQINSERKIRKK